MRSAQLRRALGVFAVRRFVGVLVALALAVAWAVVLAADRHSLTDLQAIEALLEQPKSNIDQATAKLAIDAELDRFCDSKATSDWLEAMARDVQARLSHSVMYLLDNAGNRISENSNDPSGALAKTVTRAFDALNRVQSVTGP